MAAALVVPACGADSGEVTDEVVATSFFSDIGGTTIVVVSSASNMVPGDTNGRQDLFWVNRDTGRVRSRIVGVGGVQPNYDSWGPALSAAGQIVAFGSDATNLVPGTSEIPSIYIVGSSTSGVGLLRLKDLDGTDLGEWVEQPSISSDGRYVAFVSAISSAEPEYLYIGDRLAGKVVAEVLSWNGQKPNLDAGTNFLSSPSISGNGQYIAFVSDSTNLMPTADTNGKLDLYIANRSTARVAKRILTSSGAQPNGEPFSPVFDNTGRYLAFGSYATNLVSGDTNGKPDIFIGDRVLGKTVKRIVGLSGVQPNGDSGWPSIDSAGRYVAFASAATNLVSGDTNGKYDIFIGDRTTGRVTKRILGVNGVQPDGHSDSPTISPDGRYLVFYSMASNLVSGDTNNVGDTFIASITTGRVLRRVVAYNGAQPNGATG